MLHCNKSNEGNGIPSSDFYYISTFQKPLQVEHSPKNLRSASHIATGQI